MWAWKWGILGNRSPISCLRSTHNTRIPNFFSKEMSKVIVKNYRCYIIKDLDPIYNSSSIMVNNCNIVKTMYR